MITAAIDLLSKLIATPSPSGDEHAAAAIIEQFLASNGIKPERTGNNVWACSAQFDDTKPTILLNSHLDTVRPCAGWTRDPFVPTLENGKLYGLGSNDAGASVVALAFVFTVNAWRSLCRSISSMLPPQRRKSVAQVELSRSSNASHKWMQLLLANPHHSRWQSQNAG